MSKFRHVSHVIFDMDGLILDTEGVYKNAIATIARRFGKTYTSDIVAKITGTVEKESARIAVTEMKLPMPAEEFQHEFRSLSHGFFQKHAIQLMPGARNLIQHLAKQNVPIAVATSSSLDSFELKTAKHKELFKLFDHIVCGGTDPAVKNGKPAPDIFLVAATRFPDKPSPDKCLVFEDAPNGVQAAVSAGMQVVMVPDENVPVEARKNATLVVNSLDKTPLEQFGLPPIK
ncbi:probable pseudouridine-5'-phosphatase isoform X1 [Dendroctonus ponderosae]|uniref:Pseudouridine-5'-phosphatase n=1 Tax=Dendroctonus ponderosae TaxID=77166 RepID=J3JV25_DENPD|nr:probable pseudouridine-5'-phosphatase isoform X1 [Dendroctonus ponderosae]AEE62053.1 unknown [Dendroctonus ponderosae]